MATLKHGGFKMSCDLSEMLQRQFYFFGTYFLEEDILSCWETAAKGAKVVLDVGANAGIYSLAALAVQPDARRPRLRTHPGNCSSVARHC